MADIKKPKRRMRRYIVVMLLVLPWLVWALVAEPKKPDPVNQCMRELRAVATRTGASPGNVRRTCEIIQWREGR